MKDPYDIVRALVHTEKGTSFEKKGKYLFWVAKDANKVEVRKAVEDIYKIKVRSVNTIIVPGKKRRVRYKVGKTPDWKKAVVTLKEGEKISEDVT